MSDRITDEVIESLSRSYKTLVSRFNHITRMFFKIQSFRSAFTLGKVLLSSYTTMDFLQIGDAGCRTRSSTPDVLRSSGSVSVGVSSITGVLLKPTGRTSLDSEEEGAASLSFADTISQRSSDQSPMVKSVIATSFLRLFIIVKIFMAWHYTQCFCSLRIITRVIAVLNGECTMEVEYAEVR